MPNKNFEIVELDETYVAGLAIRTSNKTEQELAEKGWIATTWEEVRQMTDPNMPGAIYTGYAGGKDDKFTVVIGFKRSAIDDFKPGEVICKVPAGKYARFARKGPLSAAAIEAWQDVWKAEETGALQRAYTADLETYQGMSEGNLSNLTVELYIAIE